MKDVNLADLDTKGWVDPEDVANAIYTTFAQIASGVGQSVEAVMEIRVDDRRARRPWVYDRIL